MTTSVIPIILNEEIVEKIRFLCKNIVRVEWSGILFYTVEGSIQTPKECRIIVQDILLMDKGTGGYTEYEWDGDDVVGFKMEHENPEAMDWKMGHIHSHNVMDVFFSPVDMDELNDNCPQHNIYVSVIVNNYLETKAKVAFTAKPHTFECLDEEGNKYDLAITGDYDPYMFIYEAEVQAPIINVKVPKGFESRYLEVERNVSKKNLQKAADEREKKRKEEEKKKQTKSLPPNSTTYPPQNNPPASIPDWNGSKSIASKLEQIESERTYADDDPTIDELFAAYVLRMGTHLTKDTLEDALTDLSMGKVSENIVAASIKDCFPAYYNYFYEKEKGFGTKEHFEDTCNIVLELYNEQVEVYDFLAPIIDALEDVVEEADKAIDSALTLTETKKQFI